MSRSPPQQQLFPALPTNVCKAMLRDAMDDRFEETAWQR